MSWDRKPRESHYVGSRVRTSSVVRQSPAVVRTVTASDRRAMPTAPSDADNSCLVTYANGVEFLAAGHDARVPFGMKSRPLLGPAKGAVMRQRKESAARKARVERLRRLENHPIFAPVEFKPAEKLQLESTTAAVVEGK